MQSANGIRAILFDFDGTLRHNLPSGGEVFTDFVVRYGLPVTQEDRHRAARWEHYYFANSPEIQADQKKFDGEGEDFWSNFNHRRLVALGCPSELVQELAPKVSAYMQEAYKPVDWIPEEVHTVIPDLRRNGYILGVVSNRTDPYQEEIDGLGMEGYFHFSLAAGEVHSWKPEPEIFYAALERADSTAQETLYIGDNYFADVVGAHRAGLRPVLYDPRGLFQETGCPVIASFEDLIGLLKGTYPSPRPSP
jgi:FMN phosphatase YigB (HAD superfamily)